VLCRSLRGLNRLLRCADGRGRFGRCCMHCGEYMVLGISLGRGEVEREW
jgi:hypothetical protein